MVELTEDYVRAVLPGAGWQVSGVRGSMKVTRLAERGAEAVAVKLAEVPLEILSRLAELGVTPPILATGLYEGREYVVQRAVSGPHPDHDWFAANLPRWADLVGSYLNDEPLRRLLLPRQGTWRLAVPDAVAMIDSQPAPALEPLRDHELQVRLDRWRGQATEIARLPTRPIHPDPHWHNYVIADGHPYLLDWDLIDLSDPLRDVGSQIWGFLPQQRWPEFLHRVGLPTGDQAELAIHWWAAFKMIMNAWWNDRHGDEGGAAFHADAFKLAVDRRPWLPRP
ncbi:phosphotransferase family protein [Microlunatus sp. GCM10028923]|uniref:phosphotransferase family protein n=1 Tax=Microlunatus sp. GCM10028923 TaxID=3273400 RepID=UPI003622CBB7